MSHWVKIETQIKDLTALGAACRELGCVLEMTPAGQQQANRRGDQIVATIKIGNSGYYSVQVVLKDGNYSLAGDSDYLNGTYGPIVKALGPGCRKLIQLYGVHKATAAARLKGYTVQRQPGKAGAINLVITGGAM